MSKPLKNLAEWRQYFENVGLNLDAIDLNCSVVERQLSAGVPVIFEREHLSRLLGVHAGFFDFCLSRPQENYRVFEIPKRRGGVRHLVAPKQVLKKCQRWINLNILAGLKISPVVKGFVVGRSVISHAKSHHRNKFVLVVDIENFFPTIDFGRVYSVFSQVGYSQNVSTALAAICCLDRALPQGAPTSPAISNLVCSRLDKRLSALASKNKLTYTRYADDMAFSGAVFRKGFELQVYEIINQEGFRPNVKKTRIMQPKGQRIITGISIGRDKIRVPRDFKRQLRSEVYFVLKYGLVSHCLNKNIRSPSYIDTLLGRLNYWRQVEPDEIFALDLYKKLFSYKQKLV